MQPVDSPARQLSDDAAGAIGARIIRRLFETRATPQRGVLADDMDMCDRASMEMLERDIMKRERRAASGATSGAASAAAWSEADNDADDEADEDENEEDSVLPLERVIAALEAGGARSTAAACTVRTPLARLSAKTAPPTPCPASLPHRRRR